MWAAEAYGSDAVSVLAAVAARTTRIGIGSAVLQIPGRTPAMTAMTAATLDALSGGRFRLGLGVSGPQVSEGWHGVRFADPVGRTREYVADRPAGAAPTPGDRRRRALHAAAAGRAGQVRWCSRCSPSARTSRSTWPRSARGTCELTGEIADGWLAIFFDPESAGRVDRADRTRPRWAPAGTRA